MEAIKAPVNESSIDVEHVESVLSTKQRYYLDNRDKILQQQREYYQANKTRYAEIYASKKEQRAEYARQYRLNNKARLNQIQREYRERKKQPASTDASISVSQSEASP